MQRSIGEKIEMLKNARPEEAIPPGSLYNAISYSAGDPHDIESISVQGIVFNLFRNLAVGFPLRGYKP